MRHAKAAVVLLLLLLLVNSFCWGQTKAESKKPKPRLLKLGSEYCPIHGINLPWLDGAYSHDIGINWFHKDWGCAYNHQHLADYFDDIKLMNLNTVKIFLFEGFQGLQFDEKGTISGIDPTFKKNLGDIVQLAQEKNLYLYLCFANEFHPQAERGHVKNPEDDRQARAVYLEKAVKPVVRSLRGNHWIFAFDVMAEPEQDIAGETGNYRADGTTWEAMREFIKDNAYAIHSVDSSRLVTCSSGWHSWKDVAAGRFNNLGLDFFDVHNYSNDGQLPPIAELRVDRPVILGEYGQDNDEKHPVVDDNLQRRVAKAFLTNARDLGYAGALIWAYDYPGISQPDEKFLSVLKGDGSAAWRPVCNVLKEFRWTGAGGKENK